MEHVAGIVATAVACGICARVTVPWHWIVWIMLVPWLRALDRTTTWTGVAASGLAMAAAFGIVVFWWFPPAIADYAGAPLWLAAALALLGSPLFQPQFVVFALARHAARRRGRGAVGVAVVGAGAYVAAEGAFPKLFGDSLGLGLHPSPWIRQAADLAGVPGLTLALVLGNECCRASLAAWAAGARATRVLAPAAGLAMLVSGLATYGALRTATLRAAPSEPPVTVGIVQANVAHYDRLAAEIGTYAAVRRILDAHFAVSDELLARARPDALVWPETVYPTTFGAPKSPDGAAFDRAIGGLVERSRRPLVFGAYDAEGGAEYNAAVFLEPGAQGTVTFDIYRKASLFPLTERVPAWLDGPALRAWLPWLGSWQPGRGAKVMDLVVAGGRRIRIAPLICYDAVDPANAARAVADGAELIVTLSNDSWLTEGDGARLHFLVSLFRSIETRRPQVRATPTGISAVVTPEGEVVAAAGVNERAGLVASVIPVRDVPPLAVRWGSWLPPLAALVAIGWLVVGAVPSRLHEAPR
jgi:apolipoprotein N-acyltransferase